MEAFMNVIWTVDDLFWDWILPVLLLLEGIILVGLTKGKWLYKIKDIWNNSMVRSLKGGDEHGEGKISSFAAAMTNLGNTVGTGNISGCASAIAAGGPGAVFWMWAISAVGATIKSCEILLGLRYRQRLKDGSIINTREWLIGKVLKWTGAATFFAALAVFIQPLSCVAQTGSISQALNETFGWNATVVTVITVVLTFIVVSGGLHRISEFANKCVPFMCVAYMVCGILIIIMNISRVPAMFGQIFSCAFSPKAAAGGAIGYTVSAAFRYGSARGLYSTDAGIFAAGCTYATSETDHPGRQACWGLTENFLDTFIVCTVTAMAVLLSGLYTDLDGAALATGAFGALLGTPGKLIVCIATVFFAFTTNTAAFYQNSVSMSWLTRKGSLQTQNLGQKFWLVWFCAWQFLGFLDADFLWAMADFASISNTLITTIIFVTCWKECVRLTDDFWDRFLPAEKRGEKPEPVIYINDADEDVIVLKNA